MGKDLRFDILARKGLRQIAHRANHDMGACAPARGDGCHVAAEPQRALSGRADLVHHIEVGPALKPRDSVRPVEMIDDQARVVLIERIAAFDLAIDSPEPERGGLKGREHHLFGPQSMGVGQEGIERRRQMAGLLDPSLARIDPGIRIGRSLRLGGCRSRRDVEHLRAYFGQWRAPRQAPAFAWRPGWAVMVTIRSPALNSLPPPSTVCCLVATRGLATTP